MVAVLIRAATGERKQDAATRLSDQGECRLADRMVASLDAVGADLGLPEHAAGCGIKSRFSSQRSPTRTTVAIGAFSCSASACSEPGRSAYDRPGRRRRSLPGRAASRRRTRRFCTAQRSHDSRRAGSRAHRACPPRRTSTLAPVKRDSRSVTSKWLASTAKRAFSGQASPFRPWRGTVDLPRRPGEGAVRPSIQ